MLKQVQVQSLPNRVCLYLQLVVARSTVVFSSLIIVTPILQIQKFLINFVIFCWGLLLIVILKYHYLMLGVAIKFCHFFKGITSLL